MKKIDRMTKYEVLELLEKVSSSEGCNECPLRNVCKYSKEMERVFNCKEGSMLCPRCGYEPVIDYLNSEVVKVGRLDEAVKKNGVRKALDELLREYLNYCNNRDECSLCKYRASETDGNCYVNFLLEEIEWDELEE